MTSEFGMSTDIKKDCFRGKVTLLVSGGSILRSGMPMICQPRSRHFITAILPTSSKLRSPSNSGHTHVFHCVDTAHFDSATTSARWSIGGSPFNGKTQFPRLESPIFVRLTSNTRPHERLPSSWTQVGDTPTVSSPLRFRAQILLAFLEKRSRSRYTTASSSPGGSFLGRNA